MIIHYFRMPTVGKLPIEVTNIFLMYETMQRNLHTEINVLHVFSFVFCTIYIGYFNLKLSSLKKVGKLVEILNKIEKAKKSYLSESLRESLVEFKMFL